MEYSAITGLDKKISRLVFGTAMPVLMSASRDDADESQRQEAYRLLDMIYAKGINAFDCAAVYGEEILGAWMESRELRDDCVVLTKGAHPNKWRHRVTEFDILHDVHNSLKKLRTECIDIFMLHRDNHQVPVAVIVEVLNQLVSEGRIKLFGGSNWTSRRLEEANEYAYKRGLHGFAASSPNFSLARQVEDPWRSGAMFGDECVTITGPAQRSERIWYARKQMPVFAYSCMARGFFSGKIKSAEPERALEILDRPGRIAYDCPDNFERLRRCELLADCKGVSTGQIAMAWTFNQPFEVYALVSSGSEVHLEENCKALNLKLSEEEVRWLDLELDEWCKLL